MIEFINSNIDIVKLWLYVFQIFVIGIGIYVGIKNYHELIRKNNIEEAPYLRIKFNLENLNEIIFKNYGKTPINIKRVEMFIDKKLKHEESSMMSNTLPSEIMPDEEIINNFLYYHKDMTPGDYLLEIDYENHIELKTKKMLINIPEQIGFYI